MFCRTGEIMHICMSLMWKMLGRGSIYYKLQKCSIFKRSCCMELFTNVNTVTSRLYKPYTEKDGGKRPRTLFQIKKCWLSHWPVAYETGGGRPPGVKNSGQTLFSRQAQVAQKILKDEKCFNTVKNFRANSVFLGKRKLFKILIDKKYICNSSGVSMQNSAHGKV